MSWDCRAGMDNWQNLATVALGQFYGTLGTEGITALTNVFRLQMPLWYLSCSDQNLYENQKH